MLGSVQDRKLVARTIEAPDLPSEREFVKTISAAPARKKTTPARASPISAAEIAGDTHLHPPTLHRFMRTLASLGILTEQGFGGILAVGKGSANEPRFIIMEYGSAREGARKPME